eukprot:IDg19960t1
MGGEILDSQLTRDGAQRGGWPVVLWKVDDSARRHEATRGNAMRRDATRHDGSFREWRA